jgi:hypothetical protein
LIKEDAFAENFESIINFNQGDKKQLRVFLSELLKYDDMETQKVLKVLSNLLIYSIKDLQNLNDEGWKLLFNLMPSRVDEIREEINKLDDNVNDGKSDKKKSKDILEQKADWHKLERFLFHKAKMSDQFNFDASMM